MFFACQGKIEVLEVSVKKMVAIYSKHIYKENKICIFTNYRTGSSFLSRKISNLSNSVGLGEHFAYQKRDRKITNYSESVFNEEFSNIHKNKRFLIKLMADHLDYTDGYIQQVLGSVDKIIYLYRRDFAAQAKSYVAGMMTKSLGFHGYKEMETSNITTVTVPEEYKEHSPFLIDILKKNYIKMSEFYKKVPGDMYCLEDFEVQRPYRKIVVWPGTEPVIEPFDVESLFRKGL